MSDIWLTTRAVFTDQIISLAHYIILFQIEDYTYNFAILQRLNHYHNQPQCWTVTRSCSGH